MIQPPKQNTWIFPFDQLKAKGRQFAIPTYWKETKLKDGTLIKNTRRFINKVYDINDIYAYDTETYKGKCRLLACSENSKHTKINPSFIECLDFLFYNESHSNAWRFFYNIDFDYNAIIKILVKDTYRNNKSRKIMNPFVPVLIAMLNDGFEIQYGSYLIKYVKPVMLILKKGKHKVVITDLNRIFKMSLNDASLDFLDNEQKDKIDSKRLNDDLQYWIDNEKDIIKYCIQDCNLTKKLGLIFLDRLKKTKICNPIYLCSPASLSKAHFRYKCQIPKISNVPLEILQISYDCYYGGRFEILKKGSFKRMIDYDVNSEYPDMEAKLPSLKYGLWMYENEKDKVHLPVNETLGYYNCSLLIPDDNLISTIPVRINGMLRFPNGYFEGWFTWYDLDLMRDYIIEIKEQYEYKESKREYKPFEIEINKLFKLKAEYKNKDKIMYQIYKLTANALYGCCLEIHDNKLKDGSRERIAGMLFNPVYASVITAYGRWKILKPIWKSEILKHIIGFHTDSILSEIPLEQYLDIGDKLGQWNMEKDGIGYIINTGMYQIGNDKNKHIRTRGVPVKYIDDWFDFAKKNGSASKKEFVVERMTKISQALRQYKDLNLVNIMRDNKKTVNINSDKKRQWNRDFVDFSDTLDDNIESLPLIYFAGDLMPNPLLS